jgi:hypothetical protein
MDNAVTLCHHHHRVFTENPLSFSGWLEIELGAGHLEILTEKCRGILKENKIVRDEIAKHYREQIKLYEKDQSHIFVSYN